MTLENYICIYYELFLHSISWAYSCPKTLEYSLMDASKFFLSFNSNIKSSQTSFNRFFFFFLMGHGITQVNLLRYIERPNKNEKNK